MALETQRKIRDLVPIRNVLISVSDKSGLAAFAAGLVADCPGVRLFSAGATSELLASVLAVSGGSADRILVPLETYTGNPETRGHLVRILDRKIYLGLLAEEGDAAHAAELEREGAVAFDMVVGSFLPFAEAQERGADAEELRLLVDVGGPAMLSAAARNYLRVAAVSSPDDYDEVLSELREHSGAMSLARRLELAAATFRRVAEHGEAVTDWMEGLDPRELATLYRSK